MLEFIPLREEELCLALPEDHPCAKAFQEQGVDLLQLREEFFILNQHNSHFRMMEREIFSRCGFTPNVLCEISDLLASKNMVINHRGISFLPESVREEGDGCAYFSLNPPAVFYVAAAFPKGTPLTKPVRDLVMLLLKTYDRG